jgi:hypothetical protein
VKVGVTATQYGLTSRQLSAARFLLDGIATALIEAGSRAELHHGDCVGGDAQLDDIARDCCWKIVIHPPVDDSKRAFCEQPGDTVRDPKPYLERNHDIVDEVELMLAGPKTLTEQARSGTWATVRYARRIGRPVVFLDP